MSEAPYDAWTRLTDLDADISCIQNLLNLANDKQMTSEIFYLIGELKIKSDALNELVLHHGHLLQGKQIEGAV